ncbi:MAG: UxaA family hydrolase, partial [Phycisphaerae bacterium]|nr:UxaA family hydrolase [Phycisphaerae bacterium]
LCGLIAGYVNHPNVAGATVLSLGCQNAQVSMLQSRLRALSPSFDKPLHILEQQRMASEAQLIDEAIRQTFAGLMNANQCRRRPAPLSSLTVGVECGASDGFSGISANPAIGHCADLLVALGGSVILSEFPELAGAEADLVGRCSDPQVADRFLQLMADYAARADAVRSSFEENPSPANIADGLITDAIKSLGAAKKGGTSPVVDVLDYTQSRRRAGLNLLCTPGGDLESTTAMVGSGANLVLFSTGMGTPTGNAIAPVLKISSNREVAERLPDMIDLDAGGIIRGEASIESVGQRILARVIETASGAYIPCASRMEQHDFLPWKRGVSL